MIKFKHPSAEWWGIMALTFMFIFYVDPTLINWLSISIMQLSSTLFLFLGFMYWKKKELIK